MIKDRGTIKWTAMMLPEHVESLKDVLVDQKRIQKPILDEHQIEEFEMLMMESMEYTHNLKFKIFENGFIKEIEGLIHDIDHLNKQLRVKDLNKSVHYISFERLVGVHRVQGANFFD